MLFRAAESALMFGIEPNRHAFPILSGSSGQQKDVEKVRSKQNLWNLEGRIWKLKGQSSTTPCVDSGPSENKKLPTSEVKLAKPSGFWFSCLNNRNNIATKLCNGSTSVLWQLAYASKGS